MHRIIIFYILLSFALPAYSKHQFSESVYQAYWCGQHNGVMEYRLPDKTRVDCLTEQYAVEVDFANKWAECIGQAIYYGRRTKRCPACVLIMENPERDGKYLKRLRYAAYKKGVRTFTITPERLNKGMFNGNQEGQ